MDKRKYNREYYAKMSSERKREKVALQRKRIRKIRKRLDNYKKIRKCSCGENHVACLEFHHVSGKKQIEVSNAVRWGWSFEKILKEIEKCIIVCANCHRKLHHKRR